MTEIAAPYQDPSLTSTGGWRTCWAGWSRGQGRADVPRHGGDGPGGTLAGPDNMIGRPPTAEVVQTLRMNHFNLLGAGRRPELVAWHNALQHVARATALGIPVTLSTDPRHPFTDNPCMAVRAGRSRSGPSRSGFAALRRPGAGGAVRRHRPPGVPGRRLRVALHPQIDLATEPRWARIGRPSARTPT